jgi:hypothetical protein
VRLSMVAAGELLDKHTQRDHAEQHGARESDSSRQIVEPGHVPAIGKVQFRFIGYIADRNGAVLLETIPNVGLDPDFFLADHGAAGVRNA